MSRTIHLEKSFPRPIETVWIALTDRRAMAEWLMPNDFEPKQGYEFRFAVDPAGGWDGITYCAVTEVRPGHSLAYSYETPAMKGYTTQVAWRLQKAPGGTRLILDHGGFEGIGGWRLSRKIRNRWLKMTRELLPLVLDNIRNDRFRGGAVPLKQRAYKARKLSAEGVELSTGEA